MKILLVNNAATPLDKLKNLLRGNEVEEISYIELGQNLYDGYDLAVLSGGSLFSVVGNQGRLQKEIDFIRQSKIPILGICLGCEIIATTFSATLEFLGERHRQVITIKGTGESVLMRHDETFEVYESHRWAVRHVKDPLRAIALSEHAVEMLEHTTRPIVGLQFHPEHFINETTGDEIFFRAVNALTKKIIIPIPPEL